METGKRHKPSGELLIAWIPLRPTEFFARTGQPLPIVFGRLAAGVTIAAAGSEIDAITRRLVSATPDVNQTDKNLGLSP